jgi:hypothetical protein
MNQSSLRYHQKELKALPSSLVDDGGICAHPSTIVIPMPLSFRIGHLCMLLSLSCLSSSFADCCVMFMPAANKKTVLMMSPSE